MDNKIKGGNDNLVLPLSESAISSRDEYLNEIFNTLEFPNRNKSINQDTIISSNGKMYKYRLTFVAVEIGKEEFDTINAENKAMLLDANVD